MSRSNRFPGKVAFVTGAASGIGRATAIAFAAEGARVAIIDRTEDALRHTADAIKNAGGEVLVISCDVSMPQEVEAAIARTVETFGRLDIAFNNAGVENKPAPLAEIELDEWDRILNINLRGTFVCMKHELAQMLKQGGGVVINTSSGAGIRGVARGQRLCRFQARHHRSHQVCRAGLRKVEYSGERSPPRQYRDPDDGPLHRRRHPEGDRLGAGRATGQAGGDCGGGAMDEFRPWRVRNRCIDLG